MPDPFSPGTTPPLPGRMLSHRQMALDSSTVSHDPAPPEKTVPPHDPQAYDQTADLRGEICPYILMKTLLALDGMDAGQVIRVLVDYLPALRGVPKGLTTYGHSVLMVIPLDEQAGQWQIYARKAAPSAEPVRPEGQAEG